MSECLLLVLFSGACALIFNAFSPNGIALIGEWDTTRGVVSAVARNNPVVHDLEIDSVELAKEIFDQGRSVFVDARSTEDFDEGHIKGAISLPIGSVDENIEQFFETHPFSIPIITYCSGRLCQDSHELAQLLIEIGYESVNVFIDGYPVWKENGFPTENAAGAEGEM